MQRTERPAEAKSRFHESKKSAHQARGAKPAVKGAARDSHTFSRTIDSEGQQRKTGDAGRELRLVRQHRADALRSRIAMSEFGLGVGRAKAIHACS